MVNILQLEDHHCWSPYEESVFERIIEAWPAQLRQRRQQTMEESVFSHHCSIMFHIFLELNWIDFCAFVCKKHTTLG